MSTAMNQLQTWMQDRENEHLEFKEAKGNFHFEKLVAYCVALANEGGGKMILGITDKPPRRVVGTQAFRDLERTKAGLIERLHLRIEVEEMAPPEGRVLIFRVPSRALGVPVHYNGTYWMRAGEDLVPMTPDMLRRVFDESVPDFSAETFAKATLSELDRTAIERFREMWVRKSGNAALDAMPVDQLLADAELVAEGQVTYAALILFGTRDALGKHLAQSEVIFEYRSSETPGGAQQRVEFRQGYFSFLDELWSLVNLRNDLQHFQHGLFMFDVPTFNEQAVRETILNAVSHRDYRLPGSVFVRQYPRKLEVESPGGLPMGVTPENILWKQMPRNRRIAETFARCGLVERAGQGFDRIYEACIRESKPAPDFTRTDDYEVCLTLHGEVQDERFLRFLEQLGGETRATFTTRDFLVIDLVHREQPIPVELEPRLPNLVDRAIIENVGGGKYLLSRRLYGLLGQKGVFPRQRGLDRARNKSLLLEHMEDHRQEGSRMADLLQVLPSLSRRQVKGLLRELKLEGSAHFTGRTSQVRWYPDHG